MIRGQGIYARFGGKDHIFTSGLSPIKVGIIIVTHNFLWLLGQREMLTYDVEPQVSPRAR
jgi:hypothetical protein